MLNKVLELRRTNNLILVSIVDQCSTFVAELWGVPEGLTYARRLGSIELDVDSLVVTKVLELGRTNKGQG